MKKSIFLISVFFLFSCSQKGEYNGWLELTLVDSDLNGLPLSNRKVSIGVRSLKYHLFEHHLELFEGLTNEDGKVSFRPSKENEYWITVYEKHNSNSVHSMTLIKKDSTEKKELILPIKKWKLPKSSNGVPDSTYN